MGVFEQVESPILLHVIFEFNYFPLHLDLGNHFIVIRMTMMTIVINVFIIIITVSIDVTYIATNSLKCRRYDLFLSICDLNAKQCCVHEQIESKVTNTKSDNVELTLCF